MKIFNGIALEKNGKCFKFFDRNGTEYRVVFDKTTGKMIRWHYMTKQSREERGIFTDTNTGRTTLRKVV